MGGRQAFRLLIVGKSGSGKSAIAWEVIWRRPHARGDGPAAQVCPRCETTRPWWPLPWLLGLGGSCGGPTKLEVR
jgi:hypothetical protein